MKNEAIIIEIDTESPEGTQIVWETSKKFIYDFQTDLLHVLELHKYKNYCIKFLYSQNRDWVIKTGIKALDIVTEARVSNTIDKFGFLKRRADMMSR
jgi:hypothetical protein